MGRHWYVAVAVYLGYLAFSQWLWQSRFDQLLNAFLALGAIFSVCSAINSNSPFARRLLVLGKHSLLPYILQIAVMQILTSCFGLVEPFTMAFFLQIFGVLLLMIIIAPRQGSSRRKVN